MLAILSLEGQCDSGVVDILALLVVRDVGLGLVLEIRIKLLVRIFELFFYSYSLLYKLRSLSL